jgi:hypothetical protein
MRMSASSFFALGERGRHANTLAGALFVGALIATATSSCRKVSTEGLAITHVTVIDAEAGIVLADRTVAIRADRIVSVETNGPVPPHATVIDGRGMFLIPGLWDMHVHLSYARSSALPMLVANGVTGVRDMGGDLGELDRWKTQIADNVLVGPSIVRALHKVGVDFVKIYRDLPRDAFFAAAHEANTLPLPFSGHVPESVSPAEASNAGQASIEHLETLFEARSQKNTREKIRRVPLRVGARRRGTRSRRCSKPMEQW